MASWVDISTATDNIQMYKYKNKIWEIWMQTQLSKMRSAPVLLAFLSPFHTQMSVSDWVENKSVSPFALTVFAGVLLSTTQTHTHAHPYTPLHTPTPTQHTISCQTERKFPLRKRNKQKNKYKPCCCLLCWCSLLMPLSAPAAGSLSQSVGP